MVDPENAESVDPQAGPEKRKPHPGYRLRKIIWRSGGFLMRHPIFIVILMLVVLGVVAGDAWHLTREASQRTAAARAPTYASIIATLMIAMVVESIWLLRSADSYYTEEEIAEWPESVGMLKLVIALLIVLSFLFAAHGEFSALASIGVDPHSIDVEEVAAPPRAVLIQLVVLGLGLAARFFTVASSPPATLGE